MVPDNREEVKGVLNIGGKTIDVRFNGKGLLRLWANLGQYNLGKKINFYSKFKKNINYYGISGNIHAEY